jgi:aminoglycoside phosphotransferase (APT) family kinase protein
MDWELSTLGHPLSDLAYHCMPWHIKDPNISVGLANANLDELNIPSEKDYIKTYCEKRNIASIDNWEFYLAFSFFRLAAIVQGVHKRSLDGNASNKHASKAGKIVKPLAQHGLDVISNGA